MATWYSPSSAAAIVGERGHTMARWTLKVMPAHARVMSEYLDVLSMDPLASAMGLRDADGAQMFAILQNLPQNSAVVHRARGKHVASVGENMASQSCGYVSTRKSPGKRLEDVL